MLASIGADPFALPATGAMPCQSPMLPSSVTFAAQTSPDAAMMTAQSTSDTRSGCHLRNHATPTNIRNPRGSTSQGDRGTAVTPELPGPELPPSTTTNG